MSAPLDVVIVTPKPSKGTLVGRIIGGSVLGPLTSGWALMLLVPLSAEALGTPHVLPSYWQSVWLVFLARMATSVFRDTKYPTFTDRRKP